MAVLLKVRNSQTFIDKLNDLLNKNNTSEGADENWLMESFPNGTFYTFYSPKGLWNNKAWFRVCPDDVRKSFNQSKGSSYNLVYRLHGTKSDNMTRELYSFYHSRFVEFLLNNLIEEIKEFAIATSLEDIKDIDKFKNYDWR